MAARLKELVDTQMHGLTGRQLNLTAVIERFALFSSRATWTVRRRLECEEDLKR